MSGEASMMKEEKKSKRVWNSMRKEFISTWKQWGSFWSSFCSLSLDLFNFFLELLPKYTGKYLKKKKNLWSNTAFIFQILGDVVSVLGNCCYFNLTYFIALWLCSFPTLPLAGWVHLISRWRISQLIHFKLINHIF